MITATKGPTEHTTVANRTFLPQSIKGHCLFIEVTEV